MTGGIIWLLFNMISNPRIVTTHTTSDKSICCINKVEGIEVLNKKPRITYNYQTDETTLRYLMTTSNIVSWGKTFPQELSDRIQDNLDKSSSGLSLNYKSVDNIDTAIENLESENNKVSFFITQLADKLKKRLEVKQLESEIIAYEGIVVFVPFSDAQRENSFPQALNGKISFDDLRKLYTGQIKNWKNLNNKLPNLPVKLYIPEDEFIVQKFKEIIFKDRETEKQDFKELLNNRKITKHKTSNTLRTILNEFENRSESKDGIGISFGALSQVYNQCSVYPLSVGEKGKEVQALLQNNGQDINPKTNLCKKGSYYPNPEVFQGKYPLKYPISVVYPDNKHSLHGEVFVDILKTEEGKALLTEAGLIPISHDN